MYTSKDSVCQATSGCNIEVVEEVVIRISM